MSNHGAGQALLALALLLQEVLAAAAVERQLAGPCLPESLFCAAVGLHLWHRGDEV